MIVAVDPGTTESAFYLSGPDSPTWDGERFGKRPNEYVLEMLATKGKHSDRGDVLVVEMIASYGMPVGAEVFTTCVWIGRFVEAWGQEHALVFRRDVKLHLCGLARAKDGNVRQALIDRYGGKDKAIGSKKQPGPLYGVKADTWQALALAVTYADQHAPAITGGAT